jgi:endonuclease G, mitochondrial
MLRLNCFYAPSMMLPIENLRPWFCAGGLAIALGLSSCQAVADWVKLRGVESPHLRLGNPSDAAAKLNLPNNFLILKPQFALSYNRDRGTANWVSWQLNQSWIGSLGRSDDFRIDSDLPAHWPLVDPIDYRERRYDRGHLIPSGDRTAKREDNSATFVMSNIIPQAPGNNRGPWNELENYCRKLAAQGKELHIVAGPLGQVGQIGKAQVVVPQSTWKVILVLDSPGLADGDLSAKTRAIAVNMPNVNSVEKQSWKAFLTTVDEIEDLTAYDFFSVLEDEVEAAVESRIDGQ